jgi:DNA-sulfur modification-associated
MFSYAEADLGKIVIHGIPISNNLFMSVLDVGTLCRIATNPLTLEKIAKNGDGADPDEVAAANIREGMQRNFLGRKRENVKEFAQYIIDVSELKRLGYIPVIGLHSENLISPQVPEGGEVKLGTPCRFVIPTTQRLTAFDGDTQLAAWHEARRQHPASLNRCLVSCVVAHGMPTGWGRQAFHDVNHFGVKVNTGEALNADDNDPMIKLAKKVACLPAFNGHVEMKAKTLRKKQTDKYVTLTSVYLAVRAFVGGQTAAKGKSKIEDSRIEEASDKCLLWFREITDVYQAHFSQGNRYILGSQCVLVALGALGHLVCVKEPGLRSVAIKSLGEVDWTKGPHWENIAVVRSIRRGRDGNEQVGYTYPNGHVHWNATLEALSNPESPLYAQIRRQVAVAV